MFGLSASEILLISVIALVLFGNDKLPQNLKKFVQSISKAKSFLFNINTQWHEIKEDIKKNIEFNEEKVKLKELIKPIDIVPQAEIDEVMQNLTHTSSIAKIDLQKDTHSNVK